MRKVELIQYEGEPAPHPKYEKPDNSKEIIFWKWVDRIVIDDSRDASFSYDPEMDAWVKRVSII
jgi:hypothetical protein